MKNRVANVRFSGNLTCFVFLTTVLIFALLPYYRRYELMKIKNIFLKIRCLELSFLLELLCASTSFYFSMKAQNSDSNSKDVLVYLGATKCHGKLFACITIWTFLNLIQFVMHINIIWRNQSSIYNKIFLKNISIFGRR